MALTPPLNTIILKIAERCNLACSYCYMYQHVDQSYRTRPAFPSQDVLDALLNKMAAYSRTRPGHQFDIVLHGGEPLLYGKERLAAFVQLARERLNTRLRRVYLQTNATLIDEEWVALFRKHNICVSVSLDGTRDAHNQFRIFHHGGGSYDDAITGLALLQRSGLDPSVLVVINPSASGLEAYRSMLALGIRKMDFLLPDQTHDHPDVNMWRVPGQHSLASYLIPIFDEWFRAANPEIRIRLFRSLLSLLMGGQSQCEALGAFPISHIVVESDGTVHMNDSFKVCADGLSLSGYNVLDSTFDAVYANNRLLAEVASGRIPLSAQCMKCSEVRTCSGGYIAHRYSSLNGFDNPSVWCQDLYAFISHVREITGL